MLLLQITLHHLLRLSSLFVGYFLPALDCVKSVVHSDHTRIRYLVIHFVILHLMYLMLTPLFHSGAVNPLLELPLVFWLSSSHTRGSLVIYECIVVPLLARFEGQVDDEIEKRSRGMRIGAMRFMLNGGAAFLRQVWEVLSNSTGTDDVDDDIRCTGTDVSRSESSEDDARSAAGAAGSLDPQHSVRQSLQSIQSSGSTDYSEQMETDDDGAYVQDFLSMLERGLYVFSHVSKDGNEAYNSTEDEGPSDKTFALKVFSYAPDNNIFRLSTVDSHHHDRDTTALLVLDIDKVMESGAQGITFAMNQTVASAQKVEMVLSDQEDRDTLLYGLKVCIDNLVERNN
mmetsp:Transcript_17543/g.35226  ORF Transcript_17543/g.35226 Transcript_17543/m.35226 type:complete len:342 (+) Transcript_17543:2578-3603(+)